MDEFFVRTEAMSVGYNGKALIENIDLCVKRREILTLIGPNGAGKSTILKSLIKQLQLVGGKVFVGGKDFLKMTEKELAQTMSVLMTERIRPEMMSCEDVVATGRYPYTGKLGILGENDKRIVRESLKRVNAIELADCDFNAISDGQRQRVLLARAISQEPDVIILDEPTSFLDIRYKLELLSILKEMVREENIAVIMSLHELDLAQRVSDTVVCVKGNTIDKVGTPEEVFTAEYITNLYGISAGSYQSAYGSSELAAPKGDPEVFVIGGGGSAIPTYRRLQRLGIPFACGVLSENDIEYPCAKALAVKCFSVPVFAAVDEASVQEALQCLRGCREVICCIEEFGEMNRGNRVLAEEAEKHK